MSYPERAVSNPDTRAESGAAPPKAAVTPAPSPAPPAAVAVAGAAAGAGATGAAASLARACARPSFHSGATEKSERITITQDGIASRNEIKREYLLGPGLGQDEV